MMKKRIFTKRKKNSRRLSFFANALLNLIYILIVCSCIYPFWLLISSSLTEEVELIRNGYKLFPKALSLDAYRYVLTNGKTIFNAYCVTIYVTIVATVLSILVMSMYGYVLSRKEFRFRKFFSVYIIFTMLFNGGMVSWYIICSQVLHLQNTWAALILPSLISGFNVMLLKSFFITSIPDAVIEAARIDGANEFRIFFTTVVPMAIPGIATVTLFVLLANWNSWYNSFMLTSDMRFQTIQLYLRNINNNLLALESSAGSMAANMSSNMLPSESARMAICVLAVGPVLIAYPFFQKFFVKGITLGAVKG